MTRPALNPSVFPTVSAPRYSGRAVLGRLVDQQVRQVRETACPEVAQASGMQYTPAHDVPPPPSLLRKRDLANAIQIGGEIVLRWLILDPPGRPSSAPAVPVRLPEIDHLLSAHAEVSGDAEIVERESVPHRAQLCDRHLHRVRDLFERNAHRHEQRHRVAAAGLAQVEEQSRALIRRQLTDLAPENLQILPRFERIAVRRRGREFARAASSCSIAT